MMQYTPIEILSMVKYLRMKGQFNYKIISTDMNNAFVVFLFISLIAACRVRRHKRYCGYPCSRNRDCKGFEMCDMRILQCRAVCNPSPCGLNEGI